MNSAAFSRAHTLWLEPPEDDPTFIEWYDAQQEKKALLEKASYILSGWYEPVNSLDDLDETLEYLERDIKRLKEIREELAELEDEFPVPYIDGDGE